MCRNMLQFNTFIYFFSKFKYVHTWFPPFGLSAMQGTVKLRVSTEAGFCSSVVIFTSTEFHVHDSAEFRKIPIL